MRIPWRDHYTKTPREEMSKSTSATECRANAADYKPGKTLITKFMMTSDKKDVQSENVTTETGSDSDTGQ